MSRPSEIDQLRNAAVRYSEAGWPILPVRLPATDQLVCGLSLADPETAREWWSDRPYGIAVRTGVLFDALEVPPWLGRLVLPAVEHQATVIEVERSLAAVWLFLVTPGSARIPDLPRAAPVRLLGGGSWILLPPTPTLGGSARWVARQPALCVLHSLTAQWSVVRAVSAARQGRTSGPSPLESLDNRLRGE